MTATLRMFLTMLLTTLCLSAIGQPMAVAQESAPAAEATDAHPIGKKPVETVEDAVASATGIAKDYGWRVFLALVVFVLSYQLIKGLVFVLDRLSERHANRRLLYKRLVPIVRLVLWGLTLTLVARGIFDVDAQGLFAAAAAIGVAVGFAAQDLLKNIFGGLVIVADRPFQVGDKIEVGGTYGEVISIGLRSTRIQTPDDSLVSVSNSQVVDSQVSNANSGELNCQVVTDLYLPGTADEQRARDIAYQTAASSRYIFLPKPIVVIVKDEFSHAHVLHLRVKAYVLDTRFEFLLMSDITERARAEFRRVGLLGAETPPAVPQQPAQNGTAIDEAGAFAPPMASIEKMNEIDQAPHTHESGENEAATNDHTSEAVNAVLAALERFFQSQGDSCLRLAGIARNGISQHDQALSQLQAALSLAPPDAWPPVADYIAHVRTAVVQALNEALSGMDLIATSTALWHDATGPIRPQLMRLAKKDQQAVSPLLPIWQSAAIGVSRLEAAVSEWTRDTLNAASAMDCSTPGAELQIPRPADAPPASGVAESSPGVDVQVYADAGARLGEALAAAASQFESLIDGVKPAAREAVVARADRLDAAFAQGDDSMANVDEAGGDADVESAALWRPWYEQANERVTLAAARMAAFDALVEFQQSIVRHITQTCPGGWSAAASAASGQLAELHQRAADIYSQLIESKDGRQAVRHATDFLKDAMQTLNHAYTGLIDADQAVRAMRESSDAALVHIHQLAGNLPEKFFLHSLPDSGITEIHPEGPVREITLRPAALEAIDQTLAPALIAASEVVGTRAKILSDEADELQTVLRFHLNAAVEELRDAYWRGNPLEVRQAADAAARELTLAGLDRVIDGLAQQKKAIAAGLTEVSGVLTDARDVVWDTVGSKVHAETAAQKLSLKTRSSFRATLLSIQRRAREQAAAVIRQIGVHTLAAIKKLSKIAHLGRTAVIGETRKIDRHATIDAVASLSVIRAGLPVVYRRLFSFYPLNDASLLAGREQDMAWLQKQWQLWLRGRANAFVLTSTAGCGLTSLLNVARQTWLRRADVCELDLTVRVADESLLVKLLMDALSMEDTDDRPVTLAALADSIMAGDRPAKFRVCVVEHLEYLFLRRIDGMELLGSMLRFVSATDSRILWIVTASDFAWQLVEKSAPLVSGLVNHYQISPYSRASVEELIIKRHRRSGLPIVFDPPAVISPLLARRLAKSETDEAKQALLRTQYFDELFVVSGQNIMLALFYWHLSIKYHEDTAFIQVNALPKLSFDFLTLLTLPEAFALKAFLEHASLTAEEYSLIANIEVEASYETFEALGNSMIVELVANEYRNIGNMEFERIEYSKRYRIRPLLLQPVIRYLRSKNIVH